MAMSTRPSRHKITVNHHILIGIDSPHVAHITEQVVVCNHPAASHQFRHWSHQPHAVADDSLEDTLLCKGSLEKLGGGRQFVDIFGVSETVSHNSGRNDDR